MNILPIPKPQDLLDLAFQRASAHKGNAPHEKRAALLGRIDVIKDTLTERLIKISRNFPTIDNLPPLYKELLATQFTQKELKMSLAAPGWAAKQLRELARKYTGKTRGARDRFDKLRNEFYGRVSSVLKDIAPSLKILALVRKEVMDLPMIRNVPTVCVFGLPNVGKSTLFKMLTGSPVKIAPYAFTTQSLNVGYLKEDNCSVQVIDTPGVLIRETKTNPIEQRAHVALKYCAHAIVFVYDVTLEKELQLKLLKSLDAYQKPVYVYLSKENNKNISIPELPPTMDYNTLRKKLLDSFRNFTLTR